MEYNEYIKQMQGLLENERNLIVNSSSNDELRRKFCAEMQHDMIELGNLLENDLNLQESEIIGLLEKMCETCYLFSEKQMSVGDFANKMYVMLFYMLDAFYWSVPKSAHELSISAIIKNEANIIEWIEYHMMVGVSHFYIYDNESTDGLKSKLKKYIDAGIVTYIYFPGKNKQFPSVNYSIEHFKYDTRWLAIIDGDEYIVPMEEGKNLPQILNEVRENYINHPMRLANFVGGVGINWRDYGTSGHKTKCFGLLFENYKYRAEDDYFQNAHIKSVVNPRVVTNVSNPHFAGYIKDYVCISEKGSYIPASYFYDSTCSKLRINHYFSKSEEELVSKNLRGWPDHDLQRDNEKEIYEASVNCVKVYDPLMDKYIDELKQNMK